LPVNLFLLLLLHLFLALELVSNKRTSSRSERTTDERPRNRMVNGTTDETPRCGSSYAPDGGPFLRSGHTGAAQKCHYEYQSYKSSEYMPHRFSFSFDVAWPWRDEIKPFWIKSNSFRDQEPYQSNAPDILKNSFGGGTGRVPSCANLSNLATRESFAKRGMNPICQAG
jgi:hypothetical protein